MNLQQIYAFLWGALGSLSIELFTINKYFKSRGSAPARYKQRTYLFARAALVAIGGGMAVAYYNEFQIMNKLLFVHVGATAPALIDYIFPSK